MFLTCNNCGWYWRTKHETEPAKCPECGQDWRKPTIWQRLSAARIAFMLGKAPAVRQTNYRDGLKKVRKAQIPEAGTDVTAGEVSSSFASPATPSQEKLI